MHTTRARSLLILVRLGLPLALLLASGRADADRYGRGQALFAQQCSACHTVGWGGRQASRTQPKRKVIKMTTVDLTGVTGRQDPRALWTFLANPNSESAGAGCRHLPLEDESVGDVVAFLRIRARPQPGKQVVPPRSAMRKWNDPAKPRPPRAAPTRSGK